VSTVLRIQLCSSLCSITPILRPMLPSSINVTPVGKRDLHNPKSAGLGVLIHGAKVVIPSLTPLDYAPPTLSYSSHTAHRNILVVLELIIRITIERNRTEKSNEEIVCVGWTVSIWIRAYPPAWTHITLKTRSEYRSRSLSI
jgi:hypothetical protein